MHYTLQFPVWSSWRINDFYHALYSSYYPYKDYDGGKSGEHGEYPTLLLTVNTILKTIKWVVVLVYYLFIILMSQIQYIYLYSISHRFYGDHIMFYENNCKILFVYKTAHFFSWRISSSLISNLQWEEIWLFLLELTSYQSLKNIHYLIVSRFNVIK